MNNQGNEMDVEQDGAQAPQIRNGQQPPTQANAPTAAQQPRLAQPLVAPEFAADYNPLQFAAPVPNLLRRNNISQAESDAVDAVLDIDWTIADIESKLKAAKDVKKRRQAQVRRVQIHFAAIRNGEQAIAAHSLNTLRVDFKDHTAAYRNAHKDGRCDFINRHQRKCIRKVIPGSQFCEQHVSDVGRSFYN